MASICTPGRCICRLVVHKSVGGCWKTGLEKEGLGLARDIDVQKEDFHVSTQADIPLSIE